MKKCTEKGSAYYYCKECEDEVIRKGHLTKPKKADFLYKTSCAVICKECK